MTMDSHLALTECKVHDLDHIEDAAEGGHTIVTPPIVVEEYCRSGTKWQLNEYETE
jgi:hypothetical protein